MGIHKELSRIFSLQSKNQYYVQGNAFLLRETARRVAGNHLLVDNGKLRNVSLPTITEPVMMSLNSEVNVGLLNLGCQPECS